MAARSSFDMSKMTTADKLVLGGAFLFFIDTFLPWQRVCVSVTGFKACGSANAWGGSGGFLGVLAAIFSILLIVWLVLNMAGTNIQVGVPSSTVTSVLLGGTVVFGLIKFLIVIFNNSFIGAWLGIILLAVLAYGGYTKMQEPTATVPPPSDPGTFPPA